LVPDAKDATPACDAIVNVPDGTEPVALACVPVKDDTE
jgi:hypothetical protein